MDISQSGQNQDEVIKVLQKFGFKFFGYNEAKQALVMAPNGQITEASTAYSFLQSQLQVAQSSGGAAESMPQMPNVSIESSAEISPEKTDQGFENSQERKESEISSVLDSGSVKTPKITLPEKKDSLYSDGYSNFDSVNLDLTDPKNVVALEEFVKSNAKKDNSDPIKWLSYMFQKAIQEQQDKLYSK